MAKKQTAGDMKRSLEEKIVEELQKTGFPTEIVSATVLEQHGWTVIHNPPYLDPNEKINREHDIYAYHTWVPQAGERRYFLSAQLIIECKKSENPWVFFTMPSRGGYGLSLRVRSGERHGFPQRSNGVSRIDGDVETFHHYFASGKVARTYHEPFKGREQAGRGPAIYAAVLAVTGATLFHDPGSDAEGVTTISYPVIIFDGPLFEAQIDSVKNISVRRADHICLSYSFIDPKDPSDSPLGRIRRLLGISAGFTIDVVQAEYWEQFLAILEQEHQTLSDRFRAALADGSLQGIDWDATATARRAAIPGNTQQPT